jgi:hypothetical protein
MIWGTIETSTFSNIDPGYTFYFEVWDEGPPGAWGLSQSDTVFWRWLTGLSASQTYNVVDGNLTVFDYDG